MSRKNKKAVKVENAIVTPGGMLGVPGTGIGGGLGFVPGNNGFSQPLTQSTPVFTNLRWYLVSNMRELLSQMYTEIGLVQTVVDVPVDDALKGGIEIKSKQLDEDQIKELQTSLDRDDDLGTIAQAAKWNRLYGGAGILIWVSDQDPEEEFILKNIVKETELELRAVDMWELYYDRQNEEGYSANLHDLNFEYYNYYSENLHKSRILKLKGKVAPSVVRQQLNGWGVSVCEVLISSINQYMKSNNLGYEVMDEFKLDVYKIKGLVSTLMSPNGRIRVQERMQTANSIKNYQNAIVMDSEDDFDHKQLSFSGLAETMAGIRMQVASDLRMPITKLFGQSVSGGLGNTDQNDIENYNSMVESQIRSKLKFDILRVCEIKCQKLFQMVPDDLTVGYKPLRELSAEQEENVKTAKFNRLNAAKAAGEISTLEYREACNKGNLFDIILDTTLDRVNPDDPQVEGILEGINENPGINPEDEDDKEPEEKEKK